MTHDHRNDNGPGPDGAMDATPLDDTLRWQLRALRRDAAPGHDLWPGIAARLATHPRQAAAPRRARWLQPVAMAASVLLVVGAVGWLSGDGFRSPPSSPTTVQATLVQREAASLTQQYQAALQELGQRDRRDPVAGIIPTARVPASLRPTFDALDRDAALIRQALARDPDSTLLLEQLRRTYAHRIALTQRLAYT